MARILIVPDKFKGTLTAKDAGEAMAKGWRQARPGDIITIIPATDGGEGFGAVMGNLLHASLQKVRMVDALGRPCRAAWWLAREANTAIFESAEVIGLALMSPARKHPFQMDTRGLLKALQAARNAGGKRCIIGIGGSATNDAGFGLARACGWRFFDSKAEQINHWIDLKDLDRVEAPDRPAMLPQITVAVDVQNPLLGPRGASNIYGPQKGLRPRDILRAEEALGRLATVMQRQYGARTYRVPGAGAAGGLGYGLITFCDARIESGFKLFSEAAGLARHIRQADVVITGEGKIDKSSLMGKATGEIARACRQVGKTCIGLAGTSEPFRGRRAYFARVAALTDLAPVDVALKNPGSLLARLASMTAREFEARKL